MRKKVRKKYANPTYSFYARSLTEIVSVQHRCVPSGGKTLSNLSVCSCLPGDLGHCLGKLMDYVASGK